VLWWLLGELEKLTGEQVTFTHRLCELSSTVAVAVQRVQEFRQIVRERHGDRLAEWVNAAEASGIAELKTFCRSLRRDWNAVAAGLRLPWSNGPTEGHVNRLKLIKRQMYGRAGFELLRARVLGPT
jgi:transposase